MTLLGHNLEFMLEKCQRHFSDKTLFMITDQLLHRLMIFHDKTGFVHRDIKPENLLMGMDKSKATLHLIDLGLAKMFLDKVSHEHVKARKIRKSLTGTAR